MFATLVYCIYDLEHRSLVFTNAGHCVPLLRRGDRVFPLQAERAHTPPLGVTPELEAGEARVQLHSGDMLIMVSDGILEARDARGNEYGLSRLSRRIRTARGNAEDIIKAILADIDGHAGDAGPGRRHDDRRDVDRPAPGEAKDHDIARGCARRRRSAPRSTSAEGEHHRDERLRMRRTTALGLASPTVSMP